MRKFWEQLSECLAVCFALALVFLFVGEPDLWDKLHQRAMSAAECTKPATQEQPR